MGGRRDKVESDVERLAQGGEFHVKQPDETDAQASISSDEPPIVASSGSPETPAQDRVPAPSEDAATESPVDAVTPAVPGDAEPFSHTDPADAADAAEAVVEGHRDSDASDTSAPDDPTSGAASTVAEADVATDQYADVAPDGQQTEDNTAAPHEEAATDHDADGTDSEASVEQVEPGVADPEASPEQADPEAAPSVTQEEESDIAQEEPADVVQEDDDSPIARELADLSARRKALDEAEIHLTGRTRVLTVSNQKGGVGKTTTTVNLAAALAERGARVLVIDLDPQGNASTALGVPHTSDIPSVYDVLIDEFPLADIIQVSPESPNLLCAPSTIHLAGAEIELVSQVAREHRLRVAVDDYLAKNPERLDFILIDCPPSLGLLTINAFTAASELLIPIQCEYYALEGLSQLLGTVQMIQKHLNPRLQLSTIMLTMYDGRTRLAQQVADEVRAHFPKEVLDTIIPRSVRVSEAPSFGQSVLAYDGQSAGAIAYREAAVEMIRRDSASNERGV